MAGAVVTFLWFVLIFVVPPGLVLAAIYYLMTPRRPATLKELLAAPENEWQTYNIPSSHRQLCECPDCMEPGLRGPFYPENTI